MKRLFLILSTMLIFFGCKHELEQPSWDIVMTVPIMYSKMTINNILEDTNINVIQNEEGFINLVYEESFLDANIDTLIKIDAIADEQTHTLDSSSFNDVIILDTTTIGETINEVPFGTILLPDGSNNIIPYLENIADDDTINIDASEYFETMTLYRGKLIVEFINGYPTDISNVSLTLVNVTNQNIVATFYFPLIPSGSLVSDSVSIAGQTIDKNLIAVLENMDINQSNGSVLIDYSDAIITTITISDIGIIESTAIFPEQQLTETLKEHNFDLGDAQLNEIGINQGTVTVNVLSTLPNGKMIYNIPSLSKNGIPFSSGDMIIPEAINSDLTSFTFNFEGYTLDLTGKQGRIGGDTVNTIYTESYTFIDYTGTLETINSTDSFYSFVEFDLTPDYVKGYLGESTIEIDRKENTLNIFNNIKADNFELQDVNLILKIDNYVGAEFQIDLIELSGKNEETSNEITLVNNEIININSATLPNNNFPINNNITELLIPAESFFSILPNKVISAAKIFLNPNGKTSTNGFFYPQFPIQTSIGFNIPLSLIAENISFVDTTKVDFPNSDEYVIDKVFLKVENGLPFSANLKLILIDENNLVVDTLLDNSIISAAGLDNNNIVLNNSTSFIEIDYNDFENVSKIVSISDFTTKPNNQFIDIYSDYELNLTISAKITKTINE